MHDDVIHHLSLSSLLINRFSIFKDVGGGGTQGWGGMITTRLNHSHSFSALKNELLKTAINLS